LREIEAPTFSDILLTDGGKVVTPTRRPLFTPRRFLVFDPRAIVRLEGLGKLKKSTSSGIRTGDLPACTIVPQATTLPRAPCMYIYRSTFFLTSAPTGGEWLVSLPGRFTPAERDPGTIWIGSRMDPRAVIDDLKKKNS
jgi:hypothetical protein